MKHLWIAVFMASCATQTVKTGSASQGLTIDLPIVINLSSGPNVITGSQLTSNGPSHALVHADSSGSSITGLALGSDLFGPSPADVAGAPGSRIFITNDDSSLPVTIAHHSTGAGADSSDWITTRTGHDVILLPGQTMTLSVNPADYVTDPITQDVSVTFHGWVELRDNAVYGVRSVSTRTPTIGTPWQPSTSRPTQVIASMTAACSISLSGGQEGEIDLLAGASNPPTQIVGKAWCKNTGTVVVGVGGTVGSAGTGIYTANPGDWLEVTTTNTTGTPAYTVSVVEQTL